ncbi:MAG: hypothetical protein H6744_13125 [Deltaproteobacteria bacterium]|nr:hypothetical protein [Deltaproteobacteria bacterium]
MVALVAATTGCSPAAHQYSGWQGHAVAGTRPLPPRGVTEPVFTIFAHGTGGHRYGFDGELISDFGAAYWGRGATNAENAFYRAHYQRTFLILDGVGTSGMPGAPDSDTPIGLATDTAPGHPMPGDFWPGGDLAKRLKPLRMRVSQMRLLKTADQAHRGDLMGDGWDDNVAHALSVLLRLHAAGALPRVVNIVGWSRGAVTALKLANAIDDVFVRGRPFRAPIDYMRGYAPENLTPIVAPVSPSISEDRLEINLFLVDPVPGRFGADGETFGSKRSAERFPPDEQDYRRLPPIVRRCLITLASDEQREGFAPLDADDIVVADASRTTVAWLPFPGNHRTQVRLEPQDPTLDYDDPPVRATLTEVPRLVRALALRFLSAAGTRLARAPDPQLLGPGGALPSCAWAIELYSRIWLRREDYHRTRNRGMGERLMGGLQPRKFTGYPFAGREYPGWNPIQGERRREDLFTAALGTYVDRPGYFINEHHRACFVRTLPALDRFLREGTPGPIPPDATRELLTLKGSPAVRETLKRLGIRLRGGRFEASPGFRFGARLGEPLRHGRAPRPARFTGALERMGLWTVARPNLRSAAGEGETPGPDFRGE